MNKILLCICITFTLAACGVRGDPQAPAPFTETK